MSTTKVKYLVVPDLSTRNLTPLLNPSYISRCVLMKLYVFVLPHLMFRAKSMMISRQSRQQKQGVNIFPQ